MYRNPGTSDREEEAGTETVEKKFIWYLVRRQFQDVV